VFNDLGRVKHLKRARPELMIAVGGCVASQEGPAIVERAPYVDVVFGPQTLHRLPELLERRRASGSASGPATSRRRSIRICGRCTTRCST
jgi:tRNA-2-methylthio-N6-dimethylallyladenosine synthase